MKFHSKNPPKYTNPYWSQYYRRPSIRIYNIMSKSLNLFVHPTPTGTPTGTPDAFSLLVSTSTYRMLSMAHVITVSSLNRLVARVVSRYTCQNHDFTRWSSFQTFKAFLHCTRELSMTGTLVVQGSTIHSCGDIKRGSRSQGTCQLITKWAWVSSSHIRNRSPSLGDQLSRKCWTSRRRLYKNQTSTGRQITMCLW